MDIPNRVRKYRKLPLRTRVLNYALFGACHDDLDIEVARYALDHGAQPSWAGYSPLHLICDKNRPEVEDSDLVAFATLLIDRGADVNALAFSWGGTPIWYAAYHGIYGLVKLLIDNGADVNLDGPHATQKIICQPLLRGQLDIASLLLDAGAETDNIDMCGADAHLAAELWLQGDTLTDALEMVGNANIARNRIANPHLFEPER
jgi:ankyrin repeat protein